MLNNLIHICEIVYSSEEMQALVEGEYVIIYILIFFIVCFLAWLFVRWIKQFFDM